MLNVCKVREWEEFRLKGEFTTELCEFDAQIRSKYLYQFTVSSKRHRIVFGIHQEDERIKDVIKRKPYMAVGFAILQKRVTGQYDLVCLKDFAADRQVELDIDLDEGEYIVLPRTSGCTLRRIPGTAKEKVELLDKYGELHPLAVLAIKDIFKRLDKVVLNHKLDFEEVAQFYARVGKQLTEKEFKGYILKKFCNDGKALNQRGFIEFFKDSVNSLGETAVWRWFEKWGFDRDLYPV